MFDVSVRVWYNHDHGGDRERIVKVESLQKFDNCLLEERASGDFLKNSFFLDPARSGRSDRLRPNSREKNREWFTRIVFGPRNVNSAEGRKNAKKRRKGGEELMAKFGNFKAARRCNAASSIYLANRRVPVARNCDPCPIVLK